MTQDCHYDFKLQAEYLQLVGSEMARKAGLGGSFGLTFLLKEAADQVQRSQGNPWPLALNDSLHDPNNVPSPKSIPIKSGKGFTMPPWMCHTGMYCRLGSYL